MKFFNIFQIGKIALPIFNHLAAGATAITAAPRPIAVMQQQKRNLLIALIGLVSLQAMAQNATISYNSTAQPDGVFTVCGVGETNSLKISNGNSATMTNTLITLHLPPGGAYVAGSISGAAESNISNLNAPVFSVPDIPASNNATITYQETFGCDVIPFQNGGGLTLETADFSYLLGGVSKTQTGVTPPSTYNVIAAALSIISFSPTSFTGNVGSSFTQTATIRNGGLGCTTSAFVKLDKAGGSVSFSNPNIGTLSNDTLYLNTAQMPGGDGKWCNGEDVTISYTVTVVNCNNLNRAVVAGWGCGGSTCQTSTPVNSNIIISNSVPNLAITIKNPNYDYCFKGELVKQAFKIVNTGTGPATKIQLTVHNSSPGGFSGNTYFDTLAVWQVKDKNGVVIGAVNNFSGSVIATGIKNSSCGTYNGIIQTTGNLTGIVLLPGDSIFVDVYSRANNFDCGQSCLFGIGWFGIRTKLDYKNQCGQGAYSVPFALQISRAYTEIRPLISVPTDVLGTAPNNTFNLDVFFTHMSLMTNPNGKGKIYLAMPLAGLDISPTVTSTTYGSYTFPVHVVNDTMLIGPLPKNVNIGGNQFRIPMQASCGSGGLKTLSLFALVQYDSTCSPVMKFSCVSSNVTIHCPAPCPKGGATPRLFTLKRINFGQPDNDNNGIPDASGVINLSKVEDHHSVNGDTLRGTWNIIINPNTEPTDPNVGLPFTHTYIDFQLGTAGLGAAGTLNALPNAAVTIYPVGGGAPINCTVSPTIVGTKAHYDFSACKPTWNGGDSMVVQALFTVNEYNTYRYNTNATSGSTIFVTANEVYSTYVAQNVPTTAPIDGLTYTCDHFNDYNQMSRIWLSPYIPSGQLITGCTNSIQSFTRHYTRNQEGANIFPFEYRNFFIANVMKVLIPHGFEYRSNTAKFNGALPILDADVTQVGDTLYFTNLKKFYTPYGGTLTPADETESRLLSFSIDATCSANPGAFNGNTMYSGIGNGVNTPSVNYGNNFWYPNSTGSGYQVYTYTAPQPVLAGGGTITTNTGTATWVVQLQNLSNAVPAANSYFYISPKNSLTNVVVKEGATTITPDANGFYHLGNLVASASRNFTISADLGKCGLDSMRVNFGYNCSAYPSVFVYQSCQTISWLKASGFPAALDMTFDKIPSSSSVDLCTPFTVEAVINSTLVGNLGSEVYKVLLPVGMSYVNGSVQVLYPVGGSYSASAYNPTVIHTVNGDTLVFTVNNLTGGVGLTGVGDLAHGRVQIKFNVETTCGYVSGKSIKAIVSGESVCNDPTASVTKTSSAININGAAATTQYSLSVTAPNSVSTCGSPKTITVRVDNTGSVAPSIADSVSINLSNGLSLVAGSVVGIHNGPSPAAPIIIGTTLRWRIPATVVPGDYMEFTMDLSANSAGCGPNTMDLYTTQSISLMCGMGSCNTPVLTGQLISDTILTCCCPPPLALCPGGSYTLTAEAGLTGIQWYKDGAPIPMATGTSYIVTMAGSYTYTAVDASGCPAEMCCPVSFEMINPTASVVSGDQAVCSGGDPVAFTETSPATGNGTLSYQWQSGTAGCAGSFANIAGAQSATYDPPTGLTQTTYYRVVVTNTVGTHTCTATSNCLTVTVIALPTVDAVSNQMVCAGAPNMAVAFSGTPASNTVFNWTNTNTNIGLGASGTGNISFTPISMVSAPETGTVGVTPVYTDISTGNVCTGATQTFAITVNPVPSITLGASPQVCRGTTTVNLPYTATTGSPDQYSIDFDAVANTDGFTDVTNASLSAGQISITVPAMAAGGVYNATVTVRNAATGCVSAATSFTITVNAITVVSATPSACVLTKYELSVVVSYGAGISGDIRVNTSNGQTALVAQTGSPQTIVIPGILADGATGIDVTTFFVSDPTCTDTKVGAYNAPAACCAIPNCGTTTVHKN